MSQCDLVIRSFAEIIASKPALNNSIPGGLHFSSQVDTKTLRPFGLIAVEELSDREYHSGGTAWVNYEIKLKIVGEQKVERMGETLDLFSGVFNLRHIFPGIRGQVVMCMSIGSTIYKDADNEYGEDILIGEKTWRVKVQESEIIV